MVVPRASKTSYKDPDPPNQFGTVTCLIILRTFDHIWKDGNRIPNLSRAHMLMSTVRSGSARLTICAIFVSLTDFSLSLAFRSNF